MVTPPEAAEQQEKEALRSWSSSKYAELAASPSVHGGGGDAGLGLNGETGRFEYLDGFYVLRRNDVSEGQRKIYDVRDYWTQDGFKQEAGFRYNACYSRRGLSYPFIQTRTTLPDFSGLHNVYFYFTGFELGTGLKWGAACFREIEPNTVEVLVAGQGSSRTADVTSLLPGDYLSAVHCYSVKVNDGFVEYAVDGDLVAVYVMGETDQSLYSGEPYAVKVAPFDIPSAMPTLFELTVEDPVGTFPEYTVDLPPRNIRWNSGSPTPSRTYRLYDEAADTLLTSGTYDTGTSHKSHPVPVAGYESATIFFRADTAATDNLTVEVLTQEGNWRTIETYSYSANDSWYVRIQVQNPLMRIGYEPDSDGASITDAEVSLR